MNKPKVMPCPYCGSMPRAWQWNHGAMLECRQSGHLVQCEGKTLDEAKERWNGRSEAEADFMFFDAISQDIAREREEANERD